MVAIVLNFRINFSNRFEPKKARRVYILQFLDDSCQWLRSVRKECK